MRRTNTRAKVRSTALQAESGFSRTALEEAPNLNTFPSHPLRGLNADTTTVDQKI